jgi:integrase/recombinase XerD
MQALIDSFELHLLAERKAPKTFRTYTEAAQRLAASLRKAGVTSWEAVTAGDAQRWIVALLAQGYSDCYANNQHRALLQFFKWHSTEDRDNPRPNPMVGLRSPKIDEKVVPVFTAAQPAALLATCKGGGFQARRDCAVLSPFRETGMRLSGLAGLEFPDVDLKRREVLVSGKGGKQRIVRFGHDTARAIDRYVRERAAHRMADSPRLWLGTPQRRPHDGQRHLPDGGAPRRAGSCGRPPAQVPASLLAYLAGQRRRRRRPDGAERLDLPADAAALWPQRRQRPRPALLRPHHGRILTAARTRLRPDGAPREPPGSAGRRFASRALPAEPR